MQINTQALVIIKSIIVILVIGILVGIGIVYFIIKKKKTGFTTESTSNHYFYLRIIDLKMRKRDLNIFLLVLGGLPLLIYPLVIVANLMMLAAIPTADNMLQVVGAILFVVIISSYLITYILCFVFNHKKIDENIFFAILPLIHLLIIILIVSIGCYIEMNQYL